MFGIMFGDIGHGGFLLLGAIWLVTNNETLKKSTNSYIEGLAQARYLFLLMGICAFYCGFIYNDFMSLPWNIFGSCYKNVINIIHRDRCTNQLKLLISKAAFTPSVLIPSGTSQPMNSTSLTPLK